MLRQAYERDTTDPEIVQVFMRRSTTFGARARIVDPARVEGSTHPPRRRARPCMGFKYDINRYLASMAIASR